ncbi:hypothetical protein BJY00DRAFT_287420 [Aspergillus carlsbadensis]|nr:hypothetical protein BJY00DRAFT_287420 [Aspergillus carlsbadensis]
MLNYVSKHGLDCGDVLAKCPSPASSVLRVAIKKNDLRSVKFLLDKGAVVQNDWELFIAIKHMFESSADPQVTTQILNLLCANGADPNMKDSSETHTLLGEVSATWALEALIKCGANPLLPRGYGRTPLEQEVEHYYGTVENVSVLPQSRYVLELPTIQLRNLLESLRDKAQASKNWHIVRFSASLHPSTGYIPRHRQCMSRSKGV